MQSYLDLDVVKDRFIGFPATGSFATKGGKASSQANDRDVEAFHIDQLARRAVEGRAHEEEASAMKEMVIKYALTGFRDRSSPR